MSARRTPLLLSLLACALSLGACERIANVRLTLVEPCNQRNQALNGVQTLEVSVAATDLPPEISTFTTDKGGQPLRVDQLVDDAVIEVRAWEGNAEDDPAIVGEAPKSLGRTPPLKIDERTAGIDIALLMGQLDGFGQATDQEGACQFMDTGASAPGRHGHTATFVPSLNKVLIVGGAVFVDNPQGGGRAESYLKSVELYDPLSGTFERLPDMTNTRAYHTATALPDGRVLIVGGFGVIGGNVDTLTTGVIYDPSLPADNPYTVVSFWQQRALHTATLLPEAQLVVIVGGCTGPGCRPDAIRSAGSSSTADPTQLVHTVEVFDIVAGQAIAQTNVLAQPRAYHAASALPGGRVVISGGVRPSGPVCTVEFLQSSGASVAGVSASNLQSTFTACPWRHAQVTLSDNRVAILGGYVQAVGGAPSGAGSSQVVFWNTQVGLEAVQGSLLTGRAGHSASLLPDGSILVVGGVIDAGGATAERLQPQGSGYPSSVLSGPPLPAAAERMAIAELPGGQILVSGGHSTALVTSDRVDLYFADLP